MTTYAEALVVFRDLCEDTIHTEGMSNEYVRGGVNLIADLFGITGLPVDERMDQVLADLRKIPMFADPAQLQAHGVAPYSHNDAPVETEVVNTDIVDLGDHVIELGDGTSYVPVIHPKDKTVGYRCQHPDGRETFIYFNPSDHVGDDVPNVFVYEGPHFDPTNDVPSHHYVIEWPGDGEDEREREAAKIVRDIAALVSEEATEEAADTGFRIMRDVRSFIRSNGSTPELDQASQRLYVWLAGETPTTSNDSSEERT